MGEGDGTVSLLSLGAMCVEGWKRKRWNPAGIKIITVEVPSRRKICIMDTAHGLDTSSSSSYPTNLSRLSLAAEATHQTT